MTTPELVILAIVVVIGIPSATWNPTAAALVISWIVGEVVYLITGNNLPTTIYLFPDFFVLAVIMAKAEAFDCRPYRGTWHQLRCILLERSGADRVVMAIFPVMWLLYVADIHPFYKWYALWSLTIAQFLAVGWESIAQFHRAGAVSARRDHPSRHEFSRLAWGRGYV